MNPCELVTFVSSIACAISTICCKEELPVMAAVFTQLGDSLATILAQEERCRDVTDDFSDSTLPFPDTDKHLPNHEKSSQNI